MSDPSLFTPASPLFKGHAPDRNVGAQHPDLGGRFPRGANNVSQHGRDQATALGVLQVRGKAGLGLRQGLHGYDRHHLQQKPLPAFRVDEPEYVPGQCYFILRGVHDGVCDVGFHTEGAYFSLVIGVLRCR